MKPLDKLLNEFYKLIKTVKEIKIKITKYFKNMNFL